MQDPNKELAHLLTTFPKTLHNLLCITQQGTEEETRHNLETKEPCTIREKAPHINLVENPEALGFHQEQRKQWKIQQKFKAWFCIKPYFIYLRKITTSFGFNTKIQNLSRYFNVSGNIIK